jgi:hypothetical protein
MAMARTLTKGILALTNASLVGRESQRFKLIHLLPVAGLDKIAF